MKRYINLLVFQLVICLTQAQTLAPSETDNNSDSIVGLQAQAQNEQSIHETLRMANDAYTKGDFRTAVDLYEDLVRGNTETYIVYYNLGNAYYKTNKIASAILNYERALMLNPGNGDIRFNLEMAKLKTVDKIDPVGEFFLTEWINGLRNVYSANQWAIAGVVSFFLLIGCLVLFFFSRRLIWKKSGFYAGVVFLVVCASSNVFSYQQKRNMKEKNTAIIFAPTVTLKGSPNSSGTDIVIVHEGAKVFVKSRLGNWIEVILENGTVGWIEDKMIEII